MAKKWLWWHINNKIKQQEPNFRIKCNCIHEFQVNMHIQQIGFCGLLNKACLTFLMIACDYIPVHNPNKCRVQNNCIVNFCPNNDHCTCKMWVNRLWIHPWVYIKNGNASCKKSVTFKTTEFVKSNMAALLWQKIFFKLW